MTLYFDAINDRYNSDLPLVYNADVTYRGPDKRNFSERYVLNLAVYKGSSPPPNGIPALVDSVNKLHGEIRKWTDGSRGLLVNTVDRAKAVRYRDRHVWIKRALKIRADHGPVAFLQYLGERWLQRRGWLR